MRNSEENMPEDIQNLTKRIMRRVYAIWFLRRTAPIFVLMPFLAIISLWETAKEFFVAKIIDNFIVAFHSPEGILAIFRFIGSAFANAPVMPLLVIGFSTGLFLILGYKLARNFMQMTLVRV